MQSSIPIISHMLLFFFNVLLNSVSVVNVTEPWLKVIKMILCYAYFITIKKINLKNTLCRIQMTNALHLVSYVSL